ncbi:MAG TPA: hypothetical protein GXZ26_10065 [Firmicutes bacterium]|nr:hypothetical protein [Bacillota bacterium]
MSGGVNKLEFLEKEQYNILLAELAAVLHDVGKFCDLHMEANSIGGIDAWPTAHSYKYVVDNPASLIKLSSRAGNLSKPDIVNKICLAGTPKAADFLPAAFKELLEKTKVAVHQEEYTLAELIMLGTPGFASHKNREFILEGKSGWLPAVLGMCHHEAHHDKQEIRKSQGMKEQRFPNILTSTVFGFETAMFTLGDPHTSLDARLISLPIHIAGLSNPRKLIHDTLIAFKYGLGDTRRPINEVTLAIWAGSVAALFKSALAGSIIDGQIRGIRKGESSQSLQGKYIDHDFRWRMLHIGFDGLRFLERAPAISDLLGRQAALQDALDNVRVLLEETFPLGNEVYRDENGSAFVVPSLKGDNAGRKLHESIENHVLEAFRNSELKEELHPRIYVTKAHKQAEVLHEILSKPLPPIAPFRDSLERWWSGDGADICTVCGVRPQGWGAPSNNQKRKAEQRNICYVCLERRGKRAREWAQVRHEIGDKDRKPWEMTIWLDEVADENGRLALVVGKFGLKQWLNGNMVQTLLASQDPSNSDPARRYIKKNPSFARIQRVWSTTQQFWQEVLEKDIRDTVRSDRKRLSIAIKNAPDLYGILGDGHAYEAEIDNRRLAVVWDDKDGGCLLTADNLQRWAEDAKTLLDRLPEELPLFEPSGSGQRRSSLGAAKIDRDQSKVIAEDYLPVIPLFAQPASFMALVPADAALDVATKISHRYELEMSKVRNRLPMLLGIIFFNCRQPLFSAIDAGRRMLKYPLADEDQGREYTVADNCKRSLMNGDCLPEHLIHSHFYQWQEISFKDEDLLWRVSTVMGDGRTPDDWYPYVNVIHDASGNPPSGRTQFEFENQQWIYVSDVQKGDVIRFTPSYFTWLYLDTSACRFEAGTKVQPLEELDWLKGIWEKLKQLARAKGLTDNRLQGIVTLLMIKRSEWGSDSEQYRQLAEAIISNEGLDGLAVQDLVSGRLEDVFFLYHSLFKRKLKEDGR